MFVYWAVLALQTGHVFLITPIHRDEAPWLFWPVLALWFAFGILYILTGTVLPAA